jgi:hypothetical protein
MAQSPYSLLTVASSAFTGAATATVDLGGLYRKLQVAILVSSDAIVGDAHLSVYKSEKPNMVMLDGGPTFEPFLVDRTLAGFDGASAYWPVTESFYRYVTAAITGTSSSFTAGNVGVALNFSGTEWPSS